MIVQCENCKTKFNVDEGRIKDEGSKVKCSQCGNVFVIYKEVPGEQPPKTELAQTTEFEAEEISREEAEDFDLGPDMDEEAAGDDLFLADEEPVFDEELPPPEEPEDESEAAGAEAPEVQEELPADEELEPLADEELEPLPDEDLDIADLSLDEEMQAESPEEQEEDLGLPVEEEAAEKVDEEQDLFIEDKAIDDLTFPGEQEEADDLGPDLTGDTFDQDIAATVLDHEVLEKYEEEIAPIAEELFDEEAKSTAVLEPKPAGRSRVFLWILIVLLAGAAVLAGLWYFTGKKPIKVKEDILGSKNITLDQKETKHFWRQNKKEGPLLVITGLAKNNNSTARSYIKLKAVLNDAQKKALIQRVFYCGNILTDDELRLLSMDEINKRLARRTGEKGANLNIGPGRSVEFMVVFNKIPDNLAGYSIEVVSSQPAKQPE